MAAPMRAAAPGWRRVRGHRAAAAAGAAGAAPQSPQQPQSPQPPPQQSTPRRRLLWDGLCIDLDGTLSLPGHIDFADMRARTGIPQGDLFAYMEQRWGSEQPERIRRAMDVILEIEAAAAAAVRPQPGLEELFAMLRDDADVKVALVTRNTHASVDAFFRVVGEHWRGVFDLVLTREHRYVKPDKRLLLDVAATWGLHPGRLLMIGDSLEDVEVANSAGAASALLKGGGNEVVVGGAGQAAPPPPPGAVPTFEVGDLIELRRVLWQTAPSPEVAAALDALTRGSSSGGGGGVAGAAAAAATAGAAAGAVKAAASSAAAAVAAAAKVDGSSLGLLGWSLRSSSDSDDDDGGDADALLVDPLSPGAPAPGDAFVDWLVVRGALRCATSSFPVMGAAAGGLAACAIGGERCVHVGCGGGALTKLLASRGLAVLGVDADVAAVARRGLRCVAYAAAAAESGGGGEGGGNTLAPGSLAEAKAAAWPTSGGADVALLYEPPQGGSGFTSGRALAPAALAELATLLRRPGGRVCAEVPVADEEGAEKAAGGAGAGAAAVEARLRRDAAAAGFVVQALLLTAGGRRVRLVAALA